MLGSARWLVVLAAMLLACTAGSPHTGIRGLSAAPAKQDAQQGLIAYAGTDGNIWVVGPDGNDREQVTRAGTLERPYGQPRWSPDGRSLTFQRGRGDSVFIAHDGVVTQVPGVTGCAYPAFFPDGETLAYACGFGEDIDADDPPSSSDLRTNPELGFVSTSRVDGAGWKVLIPYSSGDDAPGGGPLWDPFRRLTVYRIGISADGHELVLTVGGGMRGYVWTADAHDGTVGDDIGLADPESVYFDTDFLPEGGRILSMRCRGACFPQSGETTRTVEVVNATRAGTDRQVHAVVPEEANASSPSLAPDGRSVAFDLSTNGLPSVYLADIETGAQHRVVAGSSPAWQPVPAPFAGAGGGIDAPAVPMHQGGPSGSGEQPGPPPAVPPVLRWRFSVQSSLDAAPAVADGRIYVGGRDGVVRAIDPATTEEHWQAPLYGALAGPPAVVDNIVYVALSGYANLSTGGALIALDAADGAELWRVLSDAPLVSGPIVSQGAVYAANTNGAVYAVDAGTGAERWRYRAASAITSAPVVADQSVYVANADGVLAALDANNSAERWRFHTGLMQPLFAAAADGAVYLSGADGIVRAIDAATGEERWRFATQGALTTTPAVVGGTVYVGSDDGGLHALDAITGNQVWTFLTPGPFRSFPAVAGDIVVIGGMDGIVHAIDTGTGLERWQFATGHHVYAAPVVTGGVVYIASGDGYLYAVGGTGHAAG